MDNNDIVLNGHEATWNMPRIDGELGGTYTGTFVFRTFLDPMRQLQLGREYRELLGSLAIQAEQSEADLAWALVSLKHRIVKAPPFWTSTLQESGMAGNIGDLNVISVIIDAAHRSEELYKEKIKQDREKELNKSIKAAEDILKKEEEENKNEHK